MRAAVSTPAERYARSRQRAQHPVLADFVGLYSFGLDEFQLEACRALEDGDGVLVAAPTGSGKTLVGEFAVHLALEQGRKAFYTTPIKALSNQKFADLVDRYGPERVGLLTGDHTVNGEAPIVVMTTEVLRNMIYAGSRTLDGLGFVVMDEVHYLADRHRGAVWEEVIIHLPESVAVVSLSATVSNAEEFGEWLGTVRGSTRTIVEESRPVPLYQHVMVGRRIFDLFDDPGDARPGDAASAKVNPDVLRISRDDAQRSRMRDYRGKKGSGGAGRHGRKPTSQRGPGVPSRFEVVDRLAGAALLPAIYFIFSRVGCDAAVRQCLDANLRLTTPAERDTIIELVESRCAHIPAEDLHAVGYHDFLDGLSRGVAAHHAGLLPTFKECVETLFEAGLCRVVFATETLALGINMPARSVVIEKLSKWNGETHAELTPGEYTQLTGRAGRRGIDVEGHGVVLWQPGLDPSALAGMASTRTYPLRSSFRPSYNMAVNLVRQVGRETSRQLLESSFAQFQADKAVVGLAKQLRKADEALAGYAEAASCDRGDFAEYDALRRRISELEKRASKVRRADRQQAASESLTKLRPGDVIEVPAGKFSGLALVIDPGNPHDRDGQRPYVLTSQAQARRLGTFDFPTPVEALTRMRVPKSFNGRNPQSRRDLANALKAKTHGFLLPPGQRGRDARDAMPDVDPATRREIESLRNAQRAHPCHGCPDLTDHLRWYDRWHKLDRDASTLRKRIESRTHTISRQFDRVCEVLTHLEYLDGDQVTARGERLRRIYTDMDLLAAECLRRDLWVELTPSELAGALSALVYEARRAEDGPPPRLPGRGPLPGVLTDMHRLFAELEAVEREHKVQFLREPDLGFVMAAYRWAEGDDLDEVLRVSGLAAGDFVRWTKQILDLAGQVASAAAGTPLQKTARQCLDQMRRGVVAYSSMAEV
ncbi:DEAD/DEAH box helicase [Nocardioidaceae bacterium]|nr:DEAD/DEAH box helicase [Nocardioidaceae bacterium]